jgi:ABC-type lipoprotein export system ATPase subunit
MRITKVNIPESEEIADGLDIINMDKLGSIVLLAGKNGSGKTRILNKLFSTLIEKPTKSQIKDENNTIDRFKKNIASLENTIKSYKSRLYKNLEPDQQDDFIKEINKATNLQSRSPS